jgi:hypothetical protein
MSPMQMDKHAGFKSTENKYESIICSSQISHSFKMH